jgi:site-specific DNA-methyltransferase (adenine-specific)
VIYDPFAGSGSTLAAADAIGYRAVGTDRDLQYLEMGRKAFARLVAVQCNGSLAANSMHRRHWLR